jgi:transposase InsO family protein
MGQGHHGSATTTAAVRRAIQHGEASLRTLAARYGINPKTVAKWKKRSSTADRQTGPTDPRSTVLSVEDEAVIVAFRRIHTVLTDNGTHFIEPSGETWTPKEIRAMRAEGGLFRCHSFEGACADLDIEHRLTKPRHSRRADPGRTAKLSG